MLAEALRADADAYIAAFAYGEKLPKAVVKITDDSAGSGVGAAGAGYCGRA